MAKQAKPDRWKTIDTGIYKRQSIPLKRSDRKLTAAEKAKAVRALHEAFASRPSFDAWTADLAEWLQSAAKSEDSETARDARHALADLRAVKELTAVIGNRKAERLVDYAMQLGEAVERIGVRPFEPAAKIGRKNAKAREDSIATRQAEAAAKYAEWQQRAGEVRTRNPGLSIRRIASLVANQYPGDRESRKKLADKIRKKICD